MTPARTFGELDVLLGIGSSRVGRLGVDAIREGRGPVESKLSSKIRPSGVKFSDGPVRGEDPRGRRMEGEGLGGV